MPLEVMDGRGENIGIIVGYWHNHKEKKNYHIVARLGEDYNLEELFPPQDLESIAANRLGAESMLGRLNRDTLHDKLEEWWLAQGEELTVFEPYLALRSYLCVQWAYGALKAMAGVTAAYYFLYPGGEIKLKKGKLPLDINLGEMDAFAQDLPFPALIGKIIAYPEIGIDVAGVGETLLLGGGLNDMGGNNHTHSTLLPLSFGGEKTEIEVPLIVFAQKGAMLALEMDVEKGEIGMEKGRVFTGGVIYKYC